MKKAKKLLALTLAAVFTVSVAGCSKKEETVKTSEEGATLSFWTTMDGNTSVSLKSNSEMLLYKELEKRTGVKVEFIHPIAGSTGSEAFLTMLTSKEMPDIMEYWWSNYDGGPDKAIEDEVILSLNDYIKDYAPNYYDYMEGEKGKANNYLYKLQATSEKGNYYGFNTLAIGDSRCFAGICVRGDKLKEWGMEIPATIDEWTAVFAKAKDEGFEYPFTSNNDALTFKGGSHTFNTAFGVGKNFYLQGDKVVFAPFEEGFKEYLAQLNEWSRLGYIDPSYVTNDWAKLDGNLANEISVAAFHYVSDMGNITTSVKDKIPGFELVACPWPVAEKGQISEFQGVSAEAYDQALAIYAKSENIEEAIKWCDYIYSDEGNILHTFGVEGDTFEIVEIDGEKHYAYTDKITTPENSGVTSIAQAIYKYCLPANHPGLTQHPDYLASYYPLPLQKEALATWNAGVEGARVHVLPQLAYTEEEAKEKTDILEIAENALEVAISDIILGKASVDTFDAAIEEAKANGYDRVIEINQAAYDRYMAKLDKINK